MQPHLVSIKPLTDEPNRAILSLLVGALILKISVFKRSQGRFWGIKKRSDRRDQTLHRWKLNRSHGKIDNVPLLSDTRQQKEGMQNHKNRIKEEAIDARQDFKIKERCKK